MSVSVSVSVSFSKAEREAKYGVAGDLGAGEWTASVRKRENARTDGGDVLSVRRCKSGGLRSRRRC